MAWRSARRKSAFAWRWARSARKCSRWSCARVSFWWRRASRSDWSHHSAQPDCCALCFLASRRTIFRFTPSSCCCSAPRHSWPAIFRRGERCGSIPWWRCVTNEGGIMNSWLHEMRLAARSLWKRPGFTLVAILTLALGIGASTAIFSVVDAVLLRPLPYPSQDRLVEVTELNEAGRGMPFAEANFNDLAARSRSFEAIATYTRSVDAVAGGTEPVRTNILAVSAHL